MRSFRFRVPSRAVRPATRRSRCGDFLSVLIGCVTIALLAACATGGDVAERAPVLTTSGDVQAYVGDVVEIAVTVDDDDPTSVVIACSSGNPDVVDPAHLTMTGAATSRTLTAFVSHEHTGTAVVTLTASDAGGHVVQVELEIEAVPVYASSPMKLVALDGESGDLFGASVALSGPTIAIGAEEVDVGGTTAAGAAYLFGLTDGVPTSYTRITAPDAAPYDQLGSSIAIDGDRAIAGAYYADRTFEHQGAAYSARRDGAFWTGEGALLASDPAYFDTFGAAVAIDGDLVAIGAPYRDGGSTNEGAVYLYRRDGAGWTFLRRLTASDAAANASFGRSIAIEGSRVVVGANGALAGGLSVGGVYVFEGAGLAWTQVARLDTPTDLATGDAFGWSVAIDDGWIAASAPFADADGVSRGVVYVFEPDGDGWRQNDRLTGSHGGDGQHLGESIGLEGAYLVAGAPNATGDAYGQGALHVFKRWGDGHWYEVARLLAPDAGGEDHLGKSVDIDEGRILAGAVFHDVDIGNEGAAYLFER